MFPKLLKIITLIFFCFNNLNAQNQANIWYFGHGAGLHFNDGEPVFIGDGRIAATSGTGETEGSSVISDNNGDLLFYSDGETAWNKNHQVMPNGNGLLGHSSSTHAAFIVPLPLSSRYFYLFTTDSWFHTELKNGFRYSVIDMCLEDGLGNVIPDKKNILIEEFMAEKVAVVRHSNGVDYWVVSHKYKSNAFHTYRLTPDGLDVDNPIISNVGRVNENPGYEGLGAAISQMKISPNGEKLALCFANATPNVFELFDFSTESGIVSSPVDFTNAMVENFYYLATFYGIEFSPDNSKLYLSTYGGILQVNLNAGDSINIINSLTQVYAGDEIWTVGLQLAPNGKIYISNYNQNFLSVIENPNALGLDCNVVEMGTTLNSAMASYSFPSFIAGFNYNFDITGVCEPDCEGIVGGENIVDECGECLHPDDPNFNQLCRDCDNVINGENIVDECGECLHPDDPNFNQLCRDCDNVIDGENIVDECGECLHPDDPNFNQLCRDCDNVIDGENIVDQCGECLHPDDPNFNQLCADCNNVPNGGFEEDECGECLHPDDPSFNQLCADCNNIPNGDFETDECGICLSPNDPLFNLSCITTKLFIPNAFSPNNDGINDLFEVYSNNTSPISIKNYIIYNRWGQKVYVAKNFSTSDSGYWWDGTFNNKKQPIGVFSYNIEAEILNEPLQKLKGNVTLIR